MILTVAYFTSRRKPMVEWFFRSLKRELRGDLTGVEVIIVDYHMNDDPDNSRENWLRNIMKEEGVENLNLRHVPPKPCPYQGKYKKTKNEHFAASNARNTAFALCRTDYIACVDDLSVLMPGWILQLNHAAEHKYLTLGAYKKVLNLDVDRDGNARYEAFPPGVDSRWNKGSDTGIVEVTGSWLFGCSFGIPIHIVERVNGFSEKCDMTGMEDVEFGIRAGRTNVKIFYNRNMLTLESEELHSQEGNQKFIRESIMTTSGIMSDWVIHNEVVNSNLYKAQGNEFEMKDLRSSILAGNSFPLPKIDKDWRTGKLLSEL